MLFFFPFLRSNCRSPFLPPMAEGGQSFLNLLLRKRCENVQSMHHQRTDAVVLLKSAAAEGVPDTQETATERELGWIEAKFAENVRPICRLGFGKPSSDSGVRYLNLLPFVFGEHCILGVSSLPHKDTFAVLMDPLLLFQGVTVTSINLVPPTEGPPGGMVNAVQFFFSESRQELRVLCSLNSGYLKEVCVDGSPQGAAAAGGRSGGRALRNPVRTLHTLPRPLNDMTLHHQSDSVCVLIGVQDEAFFLVGRMKPSPDAPAGDPFAISEFVNVPIPLHIGVGLGNQSREHGFFTYTAFCSDGSKVACTADTDRAVLILNYSAHASMETCLTPIRLVQTTDLGAPYKIKGLESDTFAFVAGSHIGIIKVPPKDEGSETGSDIQENTHIDTSFPSPLVPVPVDEFIRFESDLAGIDCDLSSKLLVVAEKTKMSFFSWKSQSSLKGIAAQWLLFNARYLSEAERSAIPTRVFANSVSCRAGHLLEHFDGEPKICLLCSSEVEEGFRCNSCDCCYCPNCFLWGGQRQVALPEE
jgi:hypothetical protein